MNEATGVVSGGRPHRLVRLSADGVRVLGDVLHGRAAPADGADRGLLDRLERLGLIHRLLEAREVPEGAVALVVPTRDDARVGRAVSSVVSGASGAQLSEVVVVDDGSLRPVTVDAASEVVRREQPAGPGAARNLGWRSCSAQWILFLDADAVLARDALELLWDRAGDGIDIVAPRVSSRPGPSVLDRYEAERSPLDLGTEASEIDVGRRVAYVPSAAVLIRRTTLEALDGFDETMRTGEDVDFMWRANASGFRCRYEPGAVAAHDPRSTWRGVVRQRRAYGSSAAELAVRHGDRVAPAVVTWSGLTGVVGVLAGGRVGWVVSGGGVLVDAFRLHRRLAASSDAASTELVSRWETVGLVVQARLAMVNSLAEAGRRVWMPVVAVVAAASPRSRRWVGFVAFAPIVSWRPRCGLDPFRWLLGRLVDDAAYCSGVWLGLWKCRSPAARHAFLPRVARPGRPEPR